MAFQRQITDLLVEGGFVSRDDLELAQQEQQATGEKLCDVLIRHCRIDTQMRDALLRVQAQLQSEEAAIALAAGDKDNLGHRLYQTGKIDKAHYRQTLKTHPHGRRSWLRRLLRNGSLSRQQAATCLAVADEPNVAARAQVKIRLGDLLVERGDLSKKELQKALAIQKRTGQSLGSILCERGMVNEQSIKRCVKLQRRLTAAAFGTALGFASVAAHAEGQAASHAASVANKQATALLAAATTTGSIGEAINVSYQRQSAADYPQLRDAKDLKLQQALEDAMSSIGLDRALSKDLLGVTLVDVTDATNPRMAEINGETMRYAASLPKIGILFGAFQKIQDGELALTPELHKSLSRMIRHSSNSAATEMLAKVGMKDLNSMLASERYKLYDPIHGGGLWVGKPYAKSGPTQRDPIHNISHGASAIQVARYFYLLETGQLVSPSACKEMKSILANPGIKHKFVKGLESRPGSQIFRKSGSWRNYHADGAIIERNGRRYIAVALAEDSKGGAWLQKIILAMDDVIFDPANSTLFNLASASGDSDTMLR